MPTIWIIFIFNPLMSLSKKETTIEKVLEGQEVNRAMNVELQILKHL